MMAYQASADDAPRLKDTGEAGLAAVPSAVEITHLRKSDGSGVAVDDVSFSVAEGEILDMYRTFYRSPADVTALVEALGLAGKTVRFMPSGPFDEGLLTRLAEVTRVERDGGYVVVTETGGLVNAVVLALHAAGVEARDARLVWRQPTGAIAAIGVSTLILVIFGEVPYFQQSSSRLDGLSTFQIYIPILVTFSIGLPDVWRVSADVGAVGTSGVRADVRVPGQAFLPMGVGEPCLPSLLPVRI